MSFLISNQKTMKNILLCCVLLLSSFCTLSAQFDTIVGPFLADMVLYENQLLIADVTDNRVYSIDLNASNPTRTAIVFGLDTPSGIEVDGDMLYVAVGNYNSNASSRVKVYDLLNLSSTSIPEEELAETTNLPIIDVARVDGRTYVLEYQIDFDDLGYLLRVEESPSAIQSISEVSQITVFPNPTKGNI